MNEFLIKLDKKVNGAYQSSDCSASTKQQTIVSYVLEDMAMLHKKCIAIKNQRNLREILRVPLTISTVMVHGTW